MAIEYYNRLYSLQDVDEVVNPLPNFGFASLTGDEVAKLNKPFSGIEVENVVRSTERLKAPGPDGYQPIFYHKFWDSAGDSVIRFVSDCFETGNLPTAVSYTHLTLPTTTRV